MVVGHCHGEVVMRYDGLGRPEHPVSDLGQSEKRGKSCLHTFGFLHALSSPSVFCFCSSCPRVVWRQPRRRPSASRRYLL
jgi:hypothetical protein